MKRQALFLLLLCLVIVVVYYEHSLFIDNYFETVSEATPQMTNALQKLFSKDDKEFQDKLLINQTQVFDDTTIQKEVTYKSDPLLKSFNGDNKVLPSTTQIPTHTESLTQTATTTESYSGNFQQEDEQERFERQKFIAEREAVYKSRQSRINRRCKAYEKNWRKWDAIQMADRPQYVLLHVNDHHKLLWSEVPKAASSSWRYYFRNMKKNEAKDKDYAKLIKKDKKLLLEFWKSSMENGYISFMFARHPFTRILSSYKSKLEGSHLGKPFEVYHKAFGENIILKYRSEELKQSLNRESCTFSEFVSFLLYDELLLDPHWRPITLLTYPCVLNYTVIGKVETFEDDTAYLLEQAYAKQLYDRQWLNRTNATAEMQEYYSQISKEDLMGLYKRYKTDFELFDYDPEEYLKYVKD